MDICNELIGQIETNNMVRLGLTIGVLISFVASRWVTRKSIQRLADKFSYDPNRLPAIKRISFALRYALTTIILIIIWGGDLNNL